MIGVRPEYRRQGLATRMVQQALTILHGERPTLKFGVAAGNPAEAFYHRLGFLAGPVQYVLLMPPRRGQLTAECGWKRDGPGPKGRRRSPRRST